MSSEIIGAAIEVHKTLGPGLLESSYENCLLHELKLKNLNVRQQVPLPLEYKGVKLKVGYRIDLLVENLVIVEVKAVDSLADIHMAQLLTYLKIKDRKLGLLMNFNTVRMVNGVRRVVNNL